MESRPVESYREGMRRFGAQRGGGRKHAGCDLYAPLGTPIFAMDDGVVVQDLYHFYLGTYALEIQHPHFLARYGEITSRAPDGLRNGSPVRRGQLLGFVGRLSGLDLTMLHLEMYAGSASGPLTVRGSKPFQRRSDLLDPTPVLDAALDE
jgi:murein DD-endopeptidase MepM/ murein hydrolase activator NlpD